MTNSIVKRPTIDIFIEAFLAGLLLKGKNLIWIRSSNAQEERERMYTLYQYLEAQCEARRDLLEVDAEQRFLVKVRNLFTPSSIGSFGTFKQLLMRKTVWLTSYDLRNGQYYKIDIDLLHAENILEQTPILVRAISDACVAVYLKEKTA